MRGALVIPGLPAPPWARSGYRGSFPANAGVWQPHLEPPARAPFSNHRQTAGNQSRLSRGSSMGPWPRAEATACLGTLIESWFPFRAGFIEVSEALRMNPATFRDERTGGLFACFTSFATLVSLPRLSTAVSLPRPCASCCTRCLARSFGLRIVL